jgi:PKD repeat protein
MRKFTFFIVFTLVFTGVFGAQGYHVTYQQPETGLYEMNFTLGDFTLTEVTIDGVTYSKIIFKGTVYTQLKGFAEIPFINASVSLPADKNVDLKAIEGEYEDFILNYPLLPSRGVIYRDQDPSTIPYEISPGSLRDDWYPQNLATHTDPFIIKDLRGTTVYVYPFRYNAVKNVLRVYKNVVVQLKENETQPFNPLLTQPGTILREMDKIYRSLFINYEEAATDLTIGEYGDILVVCTNRDESAIQPFIDWKMEKGFNVEKIVVATGTNVKTTIQNAYNANNNLLYVQLVGDWADIKSDMLGGYAPMDPQLGCVVGSDQHPDICIGRFSANSAAHVTIQVDKVINYEKNPDLGASWYTAALGVASNQGPGDDNELDYQHINVIYNDKLDPFTYETFSTAYDPNGTAQMVSNAINAGVSIINYCGHGSETSWGSTGFSNSHINGLTNGNKLPIIFSVACVNGSFTGGSDCFAEAWLKKSNGGAVMTMMSTINQPWNPPMRGEDYFNDMLIGGYNYTAHPGQSGISTTEGRTTIGAITFNGLVLMCTESGGGEDWETAKTWHLFGDPSMQPRTDVPGDVSLSNNIIMVGVPFITTITGPDGPVEGAMVCLSKDEGYYSAISDASGTVNIPNDLTPGIAKLVVTAFNMETIYDDITVVPPGGAWIILNNAEVNDANGNGNGQADYGETVMLNVAAENVGTDPATGVTATLTSTDPYITVTDNNHSYGDIPAGSIVNGDGAFEIAIAENTPDGYSGMLEIEFTDASKPSWVSTLSIVLHAPLLELSDFTILDVTGNNNGKIDPGETVNLAITVLNDGSSDAYNLTGLLSCSDPFITINAGSQLYGDIDAGQTIEKVFSVSANISTPAGHQVTFDLALTGDLSVSVTGSFDVVVGQIPVLIIDMDGNLNSASAMLATLANIDITAEYSTSFPADLSLYNSIFLCLGIYADNHVLTSAEGQTLVNFLNNGGNLYMEGGDTWAYDTQTAVHAMFNINGSEDGSADLSTVNGVTGTFTEGMSFGYTGDNNYIDHLSPMGSAFTILNNQNPAYGTAVAYDEGNYKTIGASHEFGGLVDGGSTKEELMAAYLDFFGFTSTLQAFFTANLTEVCEGDEVEFYDMSLGGVTSWEWTFEGGTPAISTLQNPVVIYETEGIYDVILTVSDGVDTHSVTFEDYITVNICTSIEEKNIEKIFVYPNPNNGIFTVKLMEDLGENVTIKVLNSMCSVVFERENIDVNAGFTADLDLSNLNKGLYFLVIESYQGNTVQRIIIR